MTDLVLTQAGVDAMTDARTNGLLLDIIEFRLGDAYGYTATLADTALHGTTVYPLAPAIVVPTNFHTIKQPDGTDIVTLSCILGSTIGDFNFGEIGIYISSGSGTTLFGLAVFDSPLAKLASTASSEGNSIELKVKIPVGTGAPVINLNPFVATAASLGTENSFDLLTPPNVSPYNTVRSALKDEFSRAPIATEADADNWYSPQFDNLLLSGTVDSASRFALIDSDLAPIFEFYAPNVVPGRYIIQFTNGALKGLVRHIIPTPVFVVSQFLDMGAIIRPTVPNGLVYRVTVSGTTGAEPVWPLSGSVVSGTVTFVVQGPDDSNTLCWTTSTGTAPVVGTTYNLYRASSFTGLKFFIDEWMLRTRAVRFFSHHH